MGVQGHPTVGQVFCTTRAPYIAIEDQCHDAIVLFPSDFFPGNYCAHQLEHKKAEFKQTDLKMFAPCWQFAF